MWAADCVRRPGFGATRAQEARATELERGSGGAVFLVRGVHGFPNGDTIHTEDAGEELLVRHLRRRRGTATQNVRVVDECVTHVVVDDEGVRVQPGRQLDGALAGTNVLHRVAGGIVRPAGEVGATRLVGFPHAGREVVGSELALQLQEGLLREPLRRVTVNIERIVSVRTQIVVNVLVKRVLLAQVRVGGQRVSATCRFGTRTTALHFWALPVVLRVFGTCPTALSTGMIRNALEAMKPSASCIVATDRLDNGASIWALVLCWASLCLLFPKRRDDRGS